MKRCLFKIFPLFFSSFSKPASTLYVPKMYFRAHLVCTNSMGAVVNVQMVVAVQLQEVEPEHEPLQDRVGLERDDAVQVALVLRPEHRAIYLPVQVHEEVVLAQRLHRVCNNKQQNKFKFCAKK